MTSKTSKSSKIKLSKSRSSRDVLGIVRKEISNFRTHQTVQKLVDNSMIMLAMIEKLKHENHRNVSLLKVQGRRLDIMQNRMYELQQENHDMQKAIKEIQFPGLSKTKQEPVERQDSKNSENSINSDSNTFIPDDPFGPPPPLFSTDLSVLRDHTP